VRSLRDVEGAGAQRSAYGSYRAHIARVSGSVEQNNDNHRISAEVEGALVAAGGGVFAANRIDDSFAVIDARSAQHTCPEGKQALWIDR